MITKDQVTESIAKLETEVQSAKDSLKAEIDSFQISHEATKKAYEAEKDLNKKNKLLADLHQNQMNSEKKKNDFLVIIHNGSGNLNSLRQLNIAE